MAVSALPLGLGFVALFNPPQWALADSGLLAGWLLACSIWIRTAVTVFALPHLALAAEMSQDYHERSHLLGMRIGFLFLTSILLPALSMLFIFGETAGQDGRFIADNYIAFGWLCAVLTWVAAIITVGGTRGYIEATRIDPDRMPSSAGLSGIARDFFSTLKNLNFRNMLYYDLAASASYGITITLNVMAWTYYWELSATQMSVVMGAPVFLAVPAALLTLGPLGKRWPKHRILNAAIILMLLDLVWLYPLRMLDVLPANGHWLVLALLVLQNLVFIFLFVLRNVSSYSIVADLTDEHEASSGVRQEGGFYSVLAFTTKLASAAGPLYAGVALDLIGLKEGMMPGSIPADALNNLVWAMAIGILPLMLIAWRFTFRISMSEEQLLAIQQTLKDRAQA
jgi:GPH family glycoside/pentoside/hexuronide:cation symporter